MRMTSETVYDETEEEYAARKEAWRKANPGRPAYEMKPWYRTQHQEDRGLQPYADERTYGPYATIGPARAAAGTGRGQSRKVEEGTRHDGGVFRRIHTVQVGHVTWTDLDEVSPLR
ncbi:hypothetical protein [Kribbella sp. CA-293567]|uniref:hypothetical protein n=1 Tax=Kribbella sp. CA-293567 TaxID=3002436 RepID=UPI0022DD523B|nr:hypothetical protein [Kribbella sp. CA-293567]WBQ03810.1 hypothetical protein OX958_28050 [Kribbella sp. CA-293567]